jgi:hypothetical protein
MNTKPFSNPYYKQAKATIEYMLVTKQSFTTRNINLAISDRYVIINVDEIALLFKEIKRQLITSRDPKNRLKVSIYKYKAGGRSYTQYIANGEIIGTYVEFTEWFCTVKNGTLSKIRDHTKSASASSWDEIAIKELTGNQTFTSSNRDASTILKNDYPDTTWGYKGPRRISAKRVTEVLLNLYNHTINKTT